MIPYKNLGGDSNVIGYEIGNDYIIVQFTSGTGTIYTYTYSSAGTIHIENMKQYAIAGKGLNSYIATKKPAYSSKK